METVASVMGPAGIGCDGSDVDPPPEELLEEPLEPEHPNSNEPVASAAVVVTNCRRDTPRMAAILSKLAIAGTVILYTTQLFLARLFLTR